MKNSFIVLSIATILTLSRAITHADDAPAPLRDLGEPKRTQIVATLDMKIEDGKNAVWCASFVAAWKHLQNDLAGGMVALDGARDTWLKLNDAPDPVRDVPPAALYATAGLVKDGILNTIRKQVAAQFPNSKPPNLSGVDTGFVAYARLEVAAKFPVSYAKTGSPLTWYTNNDRAHGVDVHAFGLSHENVDPDHRPQPRLFYSHQDRRARIDEFILNLNAPTESTQVLIAKIPRKATLAETLRDMVQRRESQRDEMGPRGQALDEEAILAVPEMAWSVQHSFDNLLGTTFVSGPLRNAIINVARQDIDLRLDQNGAEVKSEAVIGGFGGLPKAAYYVDGPFLLAMWQRGADNPFLVVWVENDELLNTFHPDAIPAGR